MKYQYKKIRVGKGKTRDEHRIAMEKLIGRTLSRKEHVHHRNGNKLDNSIENLEVISSSEHARLHMKGRKLSEITKFRIKESVGKTCLRGEQCKNSKLSEEIVRQIKTMLKEGERLVDIGRKLGISAKAIGAIKSGRRWKHIYL